MSARLALAGLVLAAPAPVLGRQVEAGLVDSLAPRDRLVRILAGGTAERLLRLQPLHVGDSVELRSPNAQARLRLYPDGTQWVCAPGVRAGCRAGFRVPAPARRGGTVTAVAELVGAWFTGLFSGESWTRTVSAASRGDDEITIPLLPAGATIAAGRRAIDLAWTGGRPPFTVRLVRDRRGEVAVATGLNSRRASLGVVEVAPGLHAVQVRDSAGVSRLARFLVVPPDSVPSFPGAGTAGWSGGSRLLLEAVWLAGIGDGRWSWEAWLRLDRLGEDETAARVRAELEAGRLPPAR